MHRIAYRISSYSVTHGWINADDQAICCYAFERRLLTSFFLLTQLLIYAPTGKIAEASIFIAVVLTFRRRTGGIHSNSAWLCQVISTAVVLLSVFVLGPLLGRLPPLIIIISDGVLILLSFLLKPSFPPQVHFTQQDIDGNIQRKRLMLVALILIQVISIRLINMLFVIYSSIGLLFVIITVILGKLIYRKGNSKL